MMCDQDPNESAVEYDMTQAIKSRQATAVQKNDLDQYLKATW